MNHEYIKDRLSAFFDGELKNEEQFLVEEHLKTCEECRLVLEELKLLEEMVAEKAELSDNDYWEERAQRIESSLFDSAPTQITKVEKKKTGWLGWKVAGSLAAAAALMLIAVNYEEIMQEGSSKDERQLDGKPFKPVEVIEKERSIYEDEFGRIAIDPKTGDTLIPDLDIVDLGDVNLNSIEIKTDEKTDQKAEQGGAVPTESVPPPAELREELKPKPTAAAPQKVGRQKTTADKSSLLEESAITQSNNIVTKPPEEDAHMGTTIDVAAESVIDVKAKKLVVDKFADTDAVEEKEQALDQLQPPQDSIKKDIPKETYDKIKGLFNSSGEKRSLDSSVKVTSDELDKWRNTKDSLLQLMSKKSLKKSISFSQKAVKRSNRIDPEVERLLVEAYYQVAVYTEESNEFEESYAYLVKYVENEKSRYPDKARGYLDKLDKISSERE